MSCCPGSAGTLNERHRITVRYGGGRAVVVRGSVTGAEYRFSGTERLQLVDPRDAVVIARNSLFRIEGVVELPAARARFVRRGEGQDA